MKRKQILLLTIFLLLVFFVLICILALYKSEPAPRPDYRAGQGQFFYNLVKQNVSTKITFLDIGQGDATFIEFSNKQQMLIDCAKDSRILEALGRTMPFYDKSIDILVVTHPDLDHYGGCIDVLKRFHVDKIVYTGFEKQNQFFSAFKSEIEIQQQKKVQYLEIDKEQIWNIASTTVHFLFPDRPVEQTSFEGNNTSIIIKISQGEQDVLLTGDAEKELENYLIQKYGKALDVELSKVGHHGSDTSSIEPFLEATSPRIAIISAGLDNEYGHPTPRVLKRLKNIGAQIWRTDTQGDIIATITNDSLNVENHKTN